MCKLITSSSSHRSPILIVSHLANNQRTRRLRVGGNDVTMSSRYVRHVPSDEVTSTSAIAFSNCFGLVSCSADVADNRQMVKVMCHNDASPPRSVVFTRWRQCAYRSNASCLGPTRVCLPNSISIGSSVFAGFTVVSNTQTDRLATPSIAVGRTSAVYSMLPKSYIARSISFIHCVTVGPGQIGLLSFLLSLALAMCRGLCG